MEEEMKRIMKQFEEKIEKRLSDMERKISEIDKRIPKTEEEKVEAIPTSLEEKIKKFASKFGILENQLRNVFDFDTNALTLIKVKGKSEREKTQNATLAVLFGYKYCYGKNEVMSMEIRRNVAENGISLNNFATYLNAIIPSLIRRRGKPKSVKTTYRLTVPGEVKAREIIKDFATAKGEKTTYEEG